MTYFSEIAQTIDLPLVDFGSVVLAIVLPALRFVNCKLISKDEAELHVIFLFFDLLRGVAVFPFLILVAQIVYKPVLADLLTNNSTRVTLFLAGIIGSFSVFNADKWLQDHIKSMGRGIAPTDAPPSA